MTMEKLKLYHISSINLLLSSLILASISVQLNSATFDSSSLRFRRQADDSAPSLIPTSRNAFRTEVCGGQTKTISCQNPRHVIFIEDAFYGRSDATTCSVARSPDTDQSATCRSGRSFALIYANCNGRPSCRLTASNEIFGNPCRGTSKYIQMQFRCANPGESMIGFCFPNSWGSWINADTPSNGGDMELSVVHRRRRFDACENPTGMEIQYAGEVDAQWPVDSDVIRHDLNYGVSCRNAEQQGQCKDYKVRYCCLGRPTQPVRPPPVRPQPGVTCSRSSLPVDFARTLFKENWNPLETVQVRCPPGFDVIGPAEITCMANGRWSTDPGICQPPGCTGFANPLFGFVSSTRSRWRVGETVTFSCESNYVISGQATLRCQSNGEWSNSIPNCVEAPTDGCGGGRIQGLQSGKIQTLNYPDEYPPSQDCTWSIVVNPGQIIEIVFTNVDVEFERRCPFDYIEIFNGTSRQTRILKFCGTITRRMFRTNVPSITVRFVSDNQIQRRGFTAMWTAIGEGECAAPEIPNNGMLTNPKISYRVGESVSFECNTGYNLIGNNRLLCQEGVVWRGSFPICEAIQLPPLSYCFAVGDPHYNTFDKKRYDFQGICSYVLVQNTDGATGTSYIVEVDNENRGNNPNVSWLRKVLVRVGNAPSIELTKGRVVTVDGEVVNLPYQSNQHGITIRFSGRFVELKTSFGLTVVYDGDAYLAVSLPSDFAQQVEGLCGNYNGDPDDDFKNRTSDTILTDIAEFANQYQTETKPSCAPHTPMSDETCPQETRNRFTLACQVITREDGCFQACHSRIDAVPYLQDCVFDACAFNEASAALENNVGAYAKACQDLEINICPDWRETTNTPLLCGENSHYSACTTRCPATCGVTDDTECESACVEGCECNEGYVLSGDTCVKQEDCGCTYRGKYYKADEIFYPTASCNMRCICQDGSASCEDAACGTGLRCGRDRNSGRRGCIPTSYGTCRAWGDPHYMPYDASDWYEFQGICTYTLSRTNGISQTDPRWFSVEGSNEHRGDSTRVSYLRELTIRLSNGDVVTLGKDGAAMVNGQPVQEYESALFSIRPSGRFTELTTVHGLIVLFDGSGMRIRIASTYMGQVHGLCGNFNDNNEDDFETSAGALTTDINEFAQSYRVGICENDEMRPDFVCSEVERRRWRGPAYCGPLIDAGGVFAPCHSVLDAERFFRNCVFDVCATGGDQATLIQALETYAAECQANDIEICSWRAATGIVEMECPANSHYDGCASPCTDTCLNPFASANCGTSGTVEGCVCDVGYIRDGDNCIKRSECGCLLDGAYVSKGLPIRRIEQNEACTCLGQNMVECSCITGYTGRPCVDNNECQRNPCDENASCTNTQGSYTCACNAGHTGNGRECTALTCPPFEQRDFLVIAPFSIRRYRAASVVEFSCVSGYRLVGESMLTCGITGVWSSSQPRCTDIDECRRNPCDENASCTNTKSSYTCKCNEGYTGNGHECTVLTCPPFEQRDFQVITPFSIRSYRASSLVEFSCVSGYRLVGESMLTCSNNGVWSSSQSHCADDDECQQNPCDENASCTNTQGSYTCACNAGYTGNGRECTRIELPPLSFCFSVGEPHYQTFDKKRYDFHGICSYVFVQNIAGAATPSFIVEVDNENRGTNLNVSWLRKVLVRIGDAPLIELTKGRIVMVDEEVVNLPYEDTENGITIRFSGKYVELKTSFGLTLLYDGDAYLAAALPRSFTRQVEGLCGNYNGDPDDDCKSRTSDAIITDVNEFANQYQTETKPNCTVVTPQRDEICPQDMRDRFTTACEVITREDGCFQACHSRIDPTPYLRDCVFDACAFNEASVAVENNVGAYAQVCQDLEINICPDWRETTNTPIICGENSFYSACTTRCPATCSVSDDTECESACVEGCECNEGYVLSGDTCVKQEDCGCTYRGKYYKADEVFYPTATCNMRCSCQDGLASCEDAACGTGLRCGRDRSSGRRGCIPTSYGICRAWGDPHYMPYDASDWYEFQGICTYTLSRTNGISQTDPRWFSVEGSNEHRGDSTRVSYLRELTIRLSNGDVITLGKDGVAMVNGQPVQEYESALFNIRPSGRFTELTTVHGLIVLFDGSGMRIRIASTYMGQVHGLCGNFNDNNEDDFETSAGALTTDINEFAQSYRVGICENDEVRPDFVCSEVERRRWRGPAYCGPLIDAGGVFAPCHSVLDAERFFRNCVFDVCATGGDQATLIQALETYAAECQANDIEICNWREATGIVEMECPANSHYDGCASPCTDTCLIPFASANCGTSGTVEGCVCDFGYVRDGGNCIKRSECGCMMDGAYISKGLPISSKQQNEACTCLGQNMVECSCITGYTGLPCVDDDECQQNPCDENASCMNTQGSYTCACNEGYTENGRECTDFDECQQNPCDENASCTNTQGSYTCACNEGYTGNGRECTDFNECQQNPCDENASCTNTQGSYTCACNEGYTGNGRECTDFDECQQNPCDENASCTNTQGSYTCACNEGYTGNGRECTDFNECQQNPCDENASCTNTQGSYTCACNEGYTGNGRECTDFNECQQNPCDENASCTNTQGSYTCACNEGYTGNGRECTDFDECQQNPCDENASCTNTQGSYTCACNEGYTGNGRECTDFNECQQNPCDENASCTNTQGSYTCACNEGYTGNGRECTDFDECQQNPCDENASCTNTQGSYTCACNEGYTGNGRECTDFNECQQNPCDENASCTNTQGSYTCACNEGYTGNGRECTDFNECQQNPCDENASCTNTQGSYTCACNEGYTGNGRECTDFNECQQNPCDENASCTNTQGSYTCACNEGYTGNGRECTDFDECQQNPCDENASCTNTQGSYTCACNEGYTGNGRECTDFDECQQNPCDENASCTNTQGSYTCACNEGYTGNGRECTDFNECQQNPCDENASCTNTQGSYTCACNEGYTGNGRECTALLCPPFEQRDFQVITPFSVRRYHTSSVVEFSCVSGYRLVGESMLTCYNGIWSSSQPTCAGIKLPPLSFCFSVGEPHYQTFDKKRYDFHGICSYVFVQNIAETATPSFIVEVDNENRGTNLNVSWLRKVLVRVGDAPLIELTKGRIVMVDEEVVNLPYEDTENGITIRFSGKYVELKTSFGLTLLYDGDAYLAAALPRSFAEQVEGLCGNYNGDPDDDCKSRTSDVILTDANEFANQYQTETKPSCAVHTPQRDEICPQDMRDRFTTACEVITREDGCFQACHSRIDPTPYLQDCVFDACAFNEASVAVENNVGAYAQVCQDLEINICPDWRETTDTPMICGENSFYSACTTRCPATCSVSDDTECESACVEGCECNEGYVLSGDTCVKQEDCGCTYRGKYYKADEIFYPTATCNMRCSCQDGSASCEDAACGTGLRCGRDRNSGKRGCIPTSYGICRGWGDPHYMPYDASDWYDFQGVCTYILSRTNGISQTDPRWFSVEGSNEHRGGSTRVSYLRELTIRLSNGDVITLGKDGVAMVNGQPVQEYESALFNIRPSGRFTELTTVHGLIVLFDGSGMRIRIASTYIGQVHGLCGNFNGDEEDDFETSAGELTTDINEFAQSYQVGVCANNEIPPVFTCSDGNRTRWSDSEHCGPLIDSTGVFSPCNSIMNSQKFFENCVFDVCATEGDRNILIQALETYAAECQANDIEICNWRGRTGIAEMGCPANSHYDGCASLCTDTCLKPFASSNCRAPGTLEGCICDFGYVKDGDNCIKRTECGCMLGGVYVSKGSRILSRERNEECACLGQNTVECSCLNGYTGQPCIDDDECQRNLCDDNASCSNTEGSYTCACNEGYRGTGRECTRIELPPISYCLAVGDPHYVTFDNKRYDFRGVCSYVLVQNIAGATDQSFIVEVDNENRGNNPNVSWLRKVLVRVGSAPLIELMKGQLITVDGENVNLPYENMENGITIRFSGRFVELKTTFGLMLVYDGDDYLSASLPRSFAQKVEGLCGNYNGDPDDDFRNRTSNIILNDVAEFANQYQTDTKQSCSPSTTLVNSSCSDENRARYSELCSIITMANGCFSVCHSRIDPNPFFQDCIFDACAYGEAEVALENHIGAYMRGCQDLDASVCSSWRDQTATPLLCGENSFYSACTTRCPATCGVTDDQECESACVEGCECNEGYVLSGDTCVKQEECGCTYQGKYYKTDEIFYPTATCNMRCSCQDGSASCEDAACGTGLRCGRDRNSGRRGCIPTSYGICRGWGDPHYMTYDATSFYEFQGVCTYTLSRTNGISQTDPRWFSVEGSNEHRGGSTRVSYLRELTIRLSNGDVITLGKDGAATVNGQSVQAYESALFSIRPSGRFTELTTVHGLIVLFDGSGMRIRIASTYMGQVHGLCGNFNGDGEDDFETSSGELTTDINEFAQSYRVGICESDEIRPDFVCRGASRRRWSGPNYCGPLIDNTGVFGPCQSVVNAQEYFNDCVFDVCANEGDLQILIQALEAFAADCQANDIEICNWREATGITEVICPANSHYDGCASACTDTCLNPFASSNCGTSGTVESCVCDFGYVRDGGNCIKRSQCGCMMDGGGYVSRGVNIERPSEKCSCFGLNMLECVCSIGYSGQPCVDDDECQQNPCDENASCTNTQGSYTCECNEGYTGNGRVCIALTCASFEQRNSQVITPYSSTSYPVTSVVEFSCETGYRLVGESSLTCRNIGVWTSSQPRCTDINECNEGVNGNRACSEDASCRNNGGSYVCTCNAGFIGDGKTCTGSQCVRPTLRRFGTASPAGVGRFEVGDSITFGCVPGFSTSDVKVSICLVNGAWSVSPPTCSDIDECALNTHDCSVNGRCVNSVGRFFCLCNRGFNRNGKTCRRVTCPARVAPLNGFTIPGVITDFPVGLTITYICRSGYRLSGSRETMCLSTGAWSENVPTCGDFDECVSSSNTCSRNAICENRRGTYTCTCIPGYRGDGRSCEKIICGTPPGVANAIVVASTRQIRYHANSTILYECREGFELASSSSDDLTCDQDGVWSSILPRCVDIDECNPRSRRCHVAAACTNFVGGFICTCRSGFVGNGINCLEIICPPLSNPNNGSLVMFSNKIGSTVRYTCGTGYQPRYFQGTHCLRSGRWTITDLKCDDVNECFSPTQESKCGEGARCVNTRGSYECICAAGRIGDGTVCERITCDMPGMPSNGNYRDAFTFSSRGASKTRYDVGSALAFSCNRGYGLAGTSFLLCLESGEWTNVPPICTDINECRRNPHICSRNAHCNNTEGSYTCECRDGFTGDGVTCRRETANCEEPTVPNGGAFNARRIYPVNSVVTFRCLPGYILSGRRNIGCLSSGQWSHVEPRCADLNECENGRNSCHRRARCINTDGSYRCQCNARFTGNGRSCTAIRNRVQECAPLSNPVRGSVTFTRNQNVGSVAQFSCNIGWRLDSTEEVTCQPNLQWSRNEPNCVDEDECLIGSVTCPETSTCQNNAGSYLCICARGHVMIGADCVLVICEGQDLHENVVVHPANISQRVLSDVITYTCRPGYVREGAASATCLRSRQWSNGPPSCRRANFDRRYCTASGDPHYDSFDGLHYDFQGECRYDFIETTPAARTAGLVEFTVETENEFRPGVTQGTWLRRALFLFPEVSVELRKEHVVLIDGIDTDLPFTHPSGVDVRRSGRFVTITTEFGLEARYDGDHFLTVGLPASYSGFVEGLCGNYNGDPTDEFLLRGGRIMAEDNVAFGNSFQINSVSECARATASDDVCAEASIRSRYEQRCNVIREVGGCFEACHSTVDPAGNFQDCVFDLCASEGNRRALEQNIATYATACQSNDISFCDWRRDLGMPLQCQVNSHYSRCTNACPDTCVDKNSARLCPFLCVEGCECDEGFILSGKECVKEEDCGCIVEGRYYMSGKSFFIGGCNQYCNCSNGRLSCVSEGGCPEGQRCSPDDSGLLSCRLPQGSCNEEPIKKTIKLPSSCLNPDGSTKYANVGACPSVTCPRSRSQQNSDADDQCCGVATRRMEEITCRGGSVLRVSKVITCGCRQCNDRTITVSGMVYGFDAFGVETPLRSGAVMRNNRTASQTDDEGKFSINVDPDVSRVVVTFVDPNDQFMTTTKVLPFKKLGGAIFHKIRLLTKAPFTPINSIRRQILSPHSTTQSNVIKIEIEANSYFDKDGVTYPGMVSYSLTYIDPRQIESYLEAPSDLLTEDGTMMRSYGMFEMDFRDSDNMEVDVRNIRISLSADQVNIDVDRKYMRLWSLDPLTGLWIDEGEMRLSSGRDGRVFTANLPVVGFRRLLNIDVSARSTCYMKVRTYGSNAYNPSDQLSYAKVNSVFRESAIDQWRNFGSSLTLPDTGACLRVFCDVKDDVYTGTFDASINDMEYLDAAPSRRQNADVIGVSDEILQQINYQQTTVGGTQVGFSINIPRGSNTTHNKGPFYKENFDCLIAPTSDFHFRFSRKSNSLVEFNTIPIDENNMYFTWQPQPFNWWPSLTEFRACYIKVRFTRNNPTNTLLRVISKVGTNRALREQIYGIREDTSIGRNTEAAACVEFKCSGTAPSSDRTLVGVTPIRNSCRRTAINRQLGNYLRANTPFSNQSNARSYRMFAPRDALDHTHGIYTVSGNDPVIAKQLALGRCMAGQSTEVSDLMVLGNNVAVTFTC